MNFFEKVLYFLQGQMETPKPYGWFHLTCIALVIAALFILYLLRKKHSDKQLKIILGVYGITAFTLELLKQLIWSFNYDEVTKVITWDYQWYSFPFQLCTTPIFISIMCLFLKNNKLRKSLLSYMAFVTILGSIATIFMPDTCFTRDILINIHTMWLHLGSFVVSVYLLMSKEVEINFKNFKSAIKVFLVFVLIAEILNIVIYNIGILNGETFNMFFISPYFNSTLPVFSIIQPKVPYPLYLLIYIVILILCSLIIYLISFIIKKLSIRLHR